MSLSYIWAENDASVTLNNLSASNLDIVRNGHPCGVAIPKDPLDAYLRDLGVSVNNNSQAIALLGGDVDTYKVKDANSGLKVSAGFAQLDTGSSVFINGVNALVPIKTANNGIGKSGTNIYLDTNSATFINGVLSVVNPNDLS